MLYFDELISTQSLLVETTNLEWSELSFFYSHHQTEKRLLPRLLTEIKMQFQQFEKPAVTLALEFQTLSKELILRLSFWVGS